uniref:Uncharacterized protein n=1 Tax=Lygus hesperus TaxID=30085 RepID=A0A0A9XE65_LYGHE
MGKSLPFRKAISCMGVIFDPHLTWQNHVALICCRVYHALYLMRPYKHFLTNDMKSGLVRSLILPYFTYSDIIFSTGLRADAVNSTPALGLFAMCEVEST